MQHFGKIIQKICSITLQFFLMNTLFKLICEMILPIFPNFLLNTTNCKGKNLYAAFLTTLCSKYAALCCKIFFFLLSTPSRLICQVKLPLFPNFQLNTTYCKGKSLYAAFLQLYAANMQHYAAIFFLDKHPF